MNIIWALWTPPALALCSLLIAGLLAFPVFTVGHYVLLVIRRARNSNRLARCTLLAYLVLQLIGYPLHLLWKHICSHLEHVISTYAPEGLSRGNITPQ